MLPGRIVDEIVRTDGRRVLAGLIRLTGDFDAAEDALQEALTRALVVWPRDGMPSNPGAWLNTVSRRVALDRIRRDRHVPLETDIEAPLDDKLKSALLESGAAFEAVVHDAKDWEAAHRTAGARARGPLE